MIRDGHIGYKEWMSLSVISIGGKIFNPSSLIIATSGQRAAWIVSLLSGLTSQLFLFLILRFMRAHPEQSFLDVLSKRVGRWAFYWYGAIIFGAMTINGAINLRLLVDQTKIVTLPNTPVSVLMLISLLLALYLNHKGVETIGRVSYAIFPWMMAVILALFVMLVNQVRVSSLFPILGPGIEQVGLEGMKHGLYYGEVLALPLLAHLVRDQKTFEKGLKRAGFYVVAFTTAFLLLELLVLGFPASIRVSFPFLEMARLIFLGRFIQHLEGIFAAVWLIIAFVQVAIDLYLATYTFAVLFKVRSYQPLLPAMASLLFLLALLPHYFYQTLLFKDQLLMHWGGVVVYGTLVVFFLIGWLRKGRAGGHDGAAGTPHHGVLGSGGTGGHRVRHNDRG